jgi:RNA-dependent RNA polymerase
MTRMLGDSASMLTPTQIAQFRRAFLNRQFIILLNHLGVPTSLFIQIFTEAMTKARGLPGRYLEHKPTVDDDKASAGLSTFPIRELTKAGFGADLCLGDVTKVLETRLLTDLKWKARLELPGGVYLMGECGVGHGMLLLVHGMVRRSGFAAGE